MEKRPIKTRIINDQFRAVVKQQLQRVDYYKGFDHRYRAEKTLLFFDVCVALLHPWHLDCQLLSVHKQAQTCNSTKVPNTWDDRASFPVPLLEKEVENYGKLVWTPREAFILFPVDPFNEKCGSLISLTFLQLPLVAVCIFHAWAQLGFLVIKRPNSEWTSWRWCMHSRWDVVWRFEWWGVADGGFFGEVRLGLFGHYIDTTIDRQVPAGHNSWIVFLLKIKDW